MRRFTLGILVAVAALAITPLLGCGEDAEEPIEDEEVRAEETPADSFRGNWSIASVGGESFAGAARQPYEDARFDVGVDSDWAFYINGRTRFRVEWTFRKYNGRALPPDHRLFYTAQGTYVIEESSYALEWESVELAASVGLREAGFAFEGDANRVVSFIDNSASGTWVRDGEHLTLHWATGGQTVLLR